MQRMNTKVQVHLPSNMSHACDSNNGALRLPLADQASSTSPNAHHELNRRRSHCMVEKTSAVFVLGGDTKHLQSTHEMVKQMMAHASLLMLASTPAKAQVSVVLVGLAVS
eukprot:TRINITY_DN12185_c0_g3_i5.p3 TRINITY_DN12185_c0_g3~~TRINITY_DN12185_c0_g3_i5.p3  ORF type:complete len:110 (-),score=10.19 TRINITY_DN12185_c0_g3_i5:1520-1849(-)